MDQTVENKDSRKALNQLLHANGTDQLQQLRQAQSGLFSCALGAFGGLGSLGSSGMAQHFNQSELVARQQGSMNLRSEAIYPPEYVSHHKDRVKPFFTRVNDEWDPHRCGVVRIKDSIDNLRMKVYEWLYN